MIRVTKREQPYCDGCNHYTTETEEATLYGDGKPQLHDVIVYCRHERICSDLLERTHGIEDK